jgi:hypothetical protein
VCYFQSKSDEKGQTCKGFLNLLTNLDNVILLCLRSDLAYLYKRFQKRIQGDDVLLFDIKTSSEHFLQAVRSLKIHGLKGGWTQLLDKLLTLSDNLVGDVEVDGNPPVQGAIYHLHGVELHRETHRRRKTHHSYVSDMRSVDAIKNEATLSVVNFLEERLDATEWSALSPLEIFDDQVGDETLELCHTTVCPDLPLVDFVASYREASHDPRFKGKKCYGVLKELAGMPHWTVLYTSVARIVAAKPTSADVERLISYYNLMKTTDRASLAPTTLMDMLYVRVNIMPTLAEFEPRPAVFKWQNDKDRRFKSSSKATKQEWFRNVFPDAAQSSVKDTNPTDSVSVQYVECQYPNYL